MTEMTGQNAPAPAPDVRRFGDAGALMDALASSVVDALRAGIATHGRATLLVPGGHTPVPLFYRLGRASLEWSRVQVGLTDERVVPTNAAESNERLVREHLLVGAAAQAQLHGLLAGDTDPAQVEDLADLASLRLRALPHPYDVVVLGMGEDGHFASLFPGSPKLERALDLAAPPGCVAMRSPVPPHDRISLNLAALVDARRILLPMLGEVKLKVLQRALAGAAVGELPVGALLRQTRAPVSVFSAPG